MILCKNKLFIDIISIVNININKLEIIYMNPIITDKLSKYSIQILLQQY